MMPVKCHHVGISRLRAEELLLEEKKDGRFLIRDSESYSGAYTLCILYQGRVHQYRIVPDSNGMIYVQAEKGVQEKKYPNLASLVQEYLNRGSRNGLVCALLHPVEIKESPDDETDDEDEEEGEGTQSSPPSSKPPSTSVTNAVSSSSSSSSLSTDKPESTRPAIVMTKIDDGYVELDEDEGIRKYIRSRFAQLDLAGCDPSFIKRLQAYRDGDVLKDADAVQSGDMKLPQLRQLLAHEAKELNKHLEAFLAKIDICRQVFGPITTIPLTGRIQSQETDLDDLLERLSLCNSAVLKLEKKAIHRMLELTTDLSPRAAELHSQVPIIPPRRNGPQDIPSTSFEVKVKPGVLSGVHRMALEVNVVNGKLFMVKRSKEQLNEKSVFTHDRILQIIKSTSNNCRLELVIDGRKGKDTITFNDVRERESFCQLMQQMKFVHSVNQEVDRLSLFIGTWNMGDEPTHGEILMWLICQGRGKSRDKALAVLAHDMYVIGTQESGMTEKEWLALLQKTLFDYFRMEYVLVSSCSLWGIRLVILVKSQYMNKITHVHQSTVKTGIANALGNKGAAAISFSFNGTSFCFVNCHLTSGHEKNNRRNQNVLDIIKGLNLGVKTMNAFDITSRFHHVFFLGDLNYRISGLEPVTIIKQIKEENYKNLLKYDQLNNSKSSNQCFAGFVEEEITFPPTYRIARGTKDKYEWQKVKTTCIRINAPSWCDRIIYKSYPETYIINTSYGCDETVDTSDHKPVFSSFDVGIISQFAGSKSADKTDMNIIFEEVYAEMKTVADEHFKLEFYSSCLEAPVISGHSWEFRERKPGYICPQWRREQIGQMYPMVQDRDYLEDQHILVAVKSADGMESYGECVIALKSKFAQRPKPFSQCLTHHGQETGMLSGSMFVHCKDSINKRSRRSYELIYMDTEMIHQQRQLATEPQKEMDARNKPLKSVPTKLPTPDVDRSQIGDGQQESGEPFWLKNTRTKPVNPHDFVDSKEASSSSSSSSTSSLPLKPAAKTVTRKPRLGQSSLSSSTVLPATMACAGQVAEEYECASLPNFTAAFNVTPASGAAGTRNNTEATSPMSPSAYAPPVPEKRLEMHDSDEKAVLKNNVKRLLNFFEQSHKSPAYVVLRQPSSMKEWLTDLGLVQYLSLFISHGWDNIRFIKDMTSMDLKTMKITNPEHRAKILKSIASLAKEADSPV